MPRIFCIVQTPTMNHILLWSTEYSSLSVNFLPEECRKNMKKEINIYEICSAIKRLISDDEFYLRAHLHAGKNDSRKETYDGSVHGS